VNDVVPSPESPERFLIQFGEYALVDIADVWKGDRNPIKYEDISALGIDLDSVQREPMPEPNLIPPRAEILPVRIHHSRLLTQNEGSPRLSASTQTPLR